MKRLLLTFLMLVMLTPGLACTGILCFTKAAMADMPCCPKAHHEAGVKFFKDCSGVDLQAMPLHDLAAKKAVQAHDFFLPADTSFSIVPTTISQHGIRAPPPEIAASSYPPIYLSTQRLRI